MIEKVIDVARRTAARELMGLVKVQQVRKIGSGRGTKYES